MSLKFILGGSGYGKSSVLYQMVIDQSVKYPDRNALLIVPNQYTLQTQRQIIQRHPCHGVMNIDILSFERLAYRVFDELGIKTLSVLDDTGKSMIIRHLLSDHREDLKVFQGNVRKQGFTSQVKSMISELLQYDISPQLLQNKCGQVGENEKLYGKLKDIGLIYSAFMAFIQDHFITTEEILDQLCKVIDRSELIRHTTIYMDNFTGFTPVQYKLMRHLMKAADQVIIALPAQAGKDTYAIRGREDIFYLTKETILRLEEICGEEGIRRDQDLILKASVRHQDHPALKAVEQSVFRNWIHPCHEDKAAVSIVRASDPAAEMRYAAVQIHALVRSGDYRYSQIAVVSNDMNTYARYARKWFDEYHIPCFFDERRDITGNMLVRWIQALLEMIDKRFNYESVFRYLRSPYSGIGRADADMMEDYVLQFGIRGFDRWQKVWTFSDDNITPEMLIRLNELRQQLIEPVRPLYELTGRKDLTAHELICSLYLYMKHMQVKARTAEWKDNFEREGNLAAAGEYDQIYDLVIRLFEKTDQILGKDPMTVRDFQDIFKAGIEEEKVGIIPPGVDQVTFGDIRRTRIDHIKVLIFAGMNDDLVPLAESPKGLLTDNERILLSGAELTLAPTAREKLCTERYYLYASLTKPADRLILTYCGKSMDGKDKLPSEVLGQIHQILPEMAEQVYHPESSGLDGSDWHQAYREMLHGLGRVRDTQAQDPQWKAVFDWFHQNPEFRDRVEAAVEAAFFRYHDDHLSKAAVRAVYGGELTGGVTMLERYAKCAYSQFLADGIRLRERRIYEVQAFDIGRIFHQAIELFSKNITASEWQWRTVPDDIRDRMSEEAVRSVVAVYNHAVMKDSKRGEYMVDKISQMTKRTVWALQQQIIKGDFDPVDYEMRFGSRVDSDVMTITCGDEGLLSLNGQIDRLDAFEEDGKTYLKIVDYKSGATKFDLAQVYHGLQLQLLVYMNAAREQVKKNQQKPVVIPAGILYYHIDDPILEEADLQRLLADDLPESGADADAVKLLEALAMDGLVSSEEDILYHLDRHPEAKPKVLPVKLKKDGGLYANSSVASGEDFEVLLYHVRRRTREIAERIFSGDISVRPFEYDHRTGCDYCNFRSVCRFDPAVDGYEYHRLTKMDKEDIWTKLSEEDG